MELYTLNGSGIGGGGGGDTYTAGTGLELSGTEFNIDSTVLQSGDNIGSLVNDAGYLNAHPSISAASSSDNSGRTYIQDVLLDANGHITGIATATENCYRYRHNIHCWNWFNLGWHRI